jgi:hypothetical protein
VVLQRVSETLAPDEQKEKALSDRPAKAEPEARSSKGRTAVRSRPGARKANKRTKKSPAVAKRSPSTGIKRAAAQKKTLKKVVSRKAARRGSGTQKNK